MKILIKKNNHLGTLISPFGKISGSGYFTSESKYNLGTEDQYDWNKLVGYSQNPFVPNENAMMIAWRYIPSRDEFQLCPYFNIKGKNVYDDAYILRVKDNQTFYFEVSNRVFISTTGDYVEIQQPKSLKFLWYRIQAWFGGTSVPNKDISYQIFLD